MMQTIQRETAMADEPILLTDDPAPHVRRITLNRPAKRNALSNALRGQMFAALEAATGYTYFLHGEAVAWGMIAAAAIACDCGFCAPETAEQWAEPPIAAVPTQPVKHRMDRRQAPATE